jgi:hypothetical protein
MECILSVEVYDERYLRVLAGFPDVHARRAKLSQHYFYPAPTKNSAQSARPTPLTELFPSLSCECPKSTKNKPRRRSEHRLSVDRFRVEPIT